MATYGKATFDTVKYAVSRPTYPRALFDFVFAFHGRSSAAQWDTAVDLGCGTGQATVELAPRFRKVFGVDVSAKMIDTARTATSTTNTNGKIEFVQSAVEKLLFLENESVDLVVGAQAGHWFDWSKVWPEAARVLKRGGSAVFWNYSEFRLPQYPSLTPLITAYQQGSDPLNSIGPYWQQPGRSILDGHLVAVPDAGEVVPGAFGTFNRVYFTGAHYPNLPSPRSVLMRKTITWMDLYGYLQTYSALHTFREHHPEDAQHAEGELSLRFWRSLMKGAGKSKADDHASDSRAEVNGDDEVIIEWPLAVILVHKV
ncbi:S-adenosyl-L-methionine-dependent methyltransferase [Leucogyrophana mollusca]|uniref:S-adenosyl-L-methionine-dependent methyltransferase n=1 Tax=Leucogyrophana mollusca TaxID=85980 RepID=A0ACB8BU25_9AGAM|nr:S-adenosyl-L-methionine-dependent methyltransferase [Leucogyrophana mollusca]